MLRRIVFTLISTILLIFSPVFGQWESVNSGTSQHLYDVQFADDTTVFAVGYYGTVLKSVNSGESWTNLSIGSLQNLQAVYFHSRDSGFVVGQNLFKKTVDGGNSWSDVSLPVNVTWNDITFFDELHGICVGELGTILTTQDGGENWGLKNSGNTRNLSAVSFPSLDTVFVVSTAYNWEFLKSVDGGETWNTIQISPIQNLSNLESIFFLNGSLGFIGGWYLGACIKTNDGGEIWSNLDSENQMNLYDIYFSNDQTGYAVGYSGGVYKTVNQGENWTFYSFEENLLLSSIHFNQEGINGVCVGENGKIYRTSNSGGTAATKEKSESRLAEIYINHTNESLEIVMDELSWKEGYSLEIVDLKGITVLKIKIDSKHKIIPLKNLNNKMYFYRISNKSKIQNGKFIF